MTGLPQRQAGLASCCKWPMPEQLSGGVIVTDQVK